MVRHYQLLKCAFQRWPLTFSRKAMAWHSLLPEICWYHSKCWKCKNGCKTIVAYIFVGGNGIITNRFCFASSAVNISVNVSCTAVFITQHFT